MIYYWVESSGLIAQASAGLSDVDAAASPLNQRWRRVGVEADVPVDINRHYFSGDTLVAMPACPSRHHCWDFPTMAWIDPRPLSQLKTVKLTEIRKAAEAAVDANIVVQSIEFKADASTRAELAQELALAQAEGAGYSCTWERANGTAITLTGVQVRGLLRQISNRLATIRAQFRTLRAQVEAASTKAELDLINWV